MASAEASTGDHDERKIANHCAIIEKLFSARPQPVVTLKEHITQLEKAIAFLPKQKPRLIELYRDKVIQYWQLFEYGEMAQVGGKEPAPATLPPVFQSYHHSGPPPLANGGSVLNAGDNYALFGDWGTGGGDAVFARFRRPGQWEREQQSLPSAEIVRETLRAAFDRLGKISSLENFEGMKALLVLVTKARALTMVVSGAQKKLLILLLLLLLLTNSLLVSTGRTCRCWRTSSATPSSACPTACSSCTRRRTATRRCG